MVHFTKPMSAAEMKKFKEYLSARLNIKDIHIVNVQDINNSSPKNK